MPDILSIIIDLHDVVEGKNLVEFLIKQLFMEISACLQLIVSIIVFIISDPNLREDKPTKENTLHLLLKKLQDKRRSAGRPEEIEVIHIIIVNYLLQ